MRRIFSAILAAVVLVFQFVGCSSGRSGKSVPDLTGSWTQVNSNSADSVHVATIQGDTIEIYWFDKATDTKMLYWAGTFEAPTSSDEPYTWESKNDTSKTENALLASGDATKTFTYQNHQISYSASALGTTQTVKLEKDKNSEGNSSSESQGEDASSQETELTFNTPFIFDEIEISYGSELKWATVDNRYSDHDGKEVILIPTTITNKSDKTHGLNMFYYEIFGPQGLRLDSVSAYFDDNIEDVGDMRPGATATGYLSILYDGDGDYYIAFDNFDQQFEVKLPISKS